MKMIAVAGLVLGLSSCAFAAGDEAVGAEKKKGGAEFPICTMEAKLCPDGSYVSRTGPACEFALCPSKKADSSDERLLEFTITGSAQTPDPVLEQVLELERRGVVFDVIILEKFPVRIQLRATQQIISELEAIPRDPPAASQ